jgi:hypothetical protein
MDEQQMMDEYKVAFAGRPLTVLKTAGHGKVLDLGKTDDGKFELVLLWAMPGWTTKEDFESSLKIMQEVLNEAAGPVVCFADLRVQRLGLDEVILTSNKTARAERDAVMQHPKLAEYIGACSDKMIFLAMKGMGSPAFNNSPIAPFESFAEAVFYLMKKYLNPVK